MSRIYLIRHSAPTVKGLCYGWSDVPTEPFPKVAWIKSLVQSADSVVTSDLRRCLEVAWQYHDEAKPDNRLREMNFGEWEGREWTEIWKTDHERAKEWMANFGTAQAPGGESWPILCERVKAWMDQQEGTVVAFTHSGVIRAALAALLQLSPGAAFRIEVPYASLSILETQPPKVLSIGLPLVGNLPS